MNAYHMMGIIAGCTLVFAAVVAFLAYQGVHVLVAFLLVYAAVVLWMRGMQRRAGEYCDGVEQRRAATDDRRWAGSGTGYAADDALLDGSAAAPGGSL